ncbi:MAG: pyrroloquinoline quinone precursor peptide PqqA [Kiloniellales bacterium]
MGSCHARENRYIGIALTKQENSRGGLSMAWTTPKIVEICVGLEINSYVCAEL